jgi:hypothetical protein
MTRPTMRVVTQEPVVLWNDNQKAAQETNRQRREATKAWFARDKLARESNLTTAPKYRLCPCKYGLTILWSNPGYHPTLEDLEPEALSAEPVETPRLRGAVSQVQVLWSRDMIAQHPRKSREQIERENNITWAQLEHYARSSTDGLPEKSGQKAPVKATKPTKSTKKAKGA